VRRVGRRLCGAVICALLVISAPTPSTGTMAFAQPAAAPAVPDGFEPVTEVPPEEQVPAQPLVAGAYAFIWLAVLVYVGLLWRRLGAVQRDLDALKRGSSR
jgi:hypothetical protein